MAGLELLCAFMRIKTLKFLHPVGFRKSAAMVCEREGKGKKKEMKSKERKEKKR
jgi:hypothetical protein